MLDIFPRLIVLVLTATAVMLALAFRSILVPLKAVLMNSLSVAATFRADRAGLPEGTAPASFI